MISESGHSLNMPVPPEMRRDISHVIDVARAMVHLANWYTTTGKEGVHVFNVVIPKSLTMMSHLNILKAVFPKYTVEFVKGPDMSTISKVKFFHHFVRYHAL